jgi:flavin-dependent dehydrogenase
VTLLDVLVVGGGPVGLAAAVEARLAGLSVVVCEPRSTPVDKACGEGLMPGAVTALERLGVRPAGRTFAGIRYVDGRHFADHRFRSGPGLGVRRTALHAALAARVAELGIEVRHERVEVGRQDAAGVVTRAGTRGRWLLACDGLHSGVRRQLGLQRPARHPPRYGLRRHFQVTPWSDVVEVHWTPVGEVYVTPVADDVVGVAVLGGRGVDYAGVVARAAAVADRIADMPAVSDLRGAGPLRQEATRRTLGRVLLVGDAAGYVDALTGEGIRLGLAQARAAVSAVTAGRPGDYERAWRGITRDYRVLTTSLVQAASRPALRRRIVPLAARLPRVYGAIVDRLAT